jgi:hypothetical protein
MNQYPQYLNSVSETLKLIDFNGSNIRYMLIEDPLYSSEEYRKNLETDKAKFHYIAILNRMNTSNTDYQFIDEFREVYNFIMNILIEYIKGNRLSLKDLKSLLDFSSNPLS